MEEETRAENEELYSSYLQRLDDEQLIHHIKELSQSQQEHSFGGSGTPEVSFCAEKSIVIRSGNGGATESFASSSTDPFDDGLDGELLQMRIPKGENEDGVDPRDGQESGVDGDSGEEEVGSDHYSSFSSDNEVFNVGEAHGFGDYRTYFENKQRKQQIADERFREWEMQRRKLQHKDDGGNAFTDIFKGCKIFVNGYTEPSLTEVHRLVILHGGSFISFLSKKTAATHIICDHLTPSKKMRFKNYKVVKARWVEDSVKARRLLDWKSYRLIEEREYDQDCLPFKPITGASVVNEQPEANMLMHEDTEEEEQLTQEDTELQNQMVHEVTDTRGQLAHDNKVMDAKDPKFLEHFFAHSRLHHLSLWKAELRLKFLRKVLKENQSSQPRTETKECDRKVILHIDFDCFFATVSSLKHPNLKIDNDPIAVSHGRGTSDIASCNYTARSYGIRNGMWVARAKSLCPNLICIDYDFDSYENTSNKFYNYLISKGIFDHIFPVSIDEALVDVSSYFDGKSIENEIFDLCLDLKKDIKNITGCNVSIGASTNILLAKIALRKAKPNGVFNLFDGVEEFLNDIPIRDLPGIGPSIEGKVAQLDLTRDRQDLNLKYLRGFSQQKLQNLFGSKTGMKLYEYSRGIDRSSIEVDSENSDKLLGRKSISVDVNFGIRFDTIEQVDRFISDLAKELTKRLDRLGFCGSALSLRLARRSEDAPIDPPKYLGMGACDFSSKSSRLGVPTVDWGIVSAELKALYRMMNVPVKDLRGVAVTMTKLQDIEVLKKLKQSVLPFSISDNDPKHVPQKQVSSRLNEHNIDWEVFNSLPIDIKSELQNEISRRGYLMGSVGPKYASRKNTSSPQKNKNGSKVYLQQLFPTSKTEPVQFARVVETKQTSPSKSRLKKRKLTPEMSAASSPKKKEKTSDVYEYSSSFDSSVLNELPSSIKKEVLRDFEYNNKVKNFDTETMRDKMTRKNILERNWETREVTVDWINSKPKNRPSPEFLNKRPSYIEMKRNIDGWVLMSLNQGGPHKEDIDLFVTYLDNLLGSKNLNRCLLLVQYLKDSLKCIAVKNSSTHMSQEKEASVKEAMKDWNNYLDHTIVPLVQNYCNSNNAIADF